MVVALRLKRTNVGNSLGLAFRVHFGYANRLGFVYP